MIFLLQHQKKHYNNQRNEKYNTTKDKPQDQKKLVLLYACFLILLGAFVVLYINQNLAIMDLNSEVDQLQQELEVVQEKQQDLRLELTRETSLAKIERIARDELNMVQPENTQTLVLNQHNENQDEIKDQQIDRFFLAAFFADLWQELNSVKADAPE